MFFKVSVTLIAHYRSNTHTHTHTHTPVQRSCCSLACWWDAPLTCQTDTLSQTDSSSVFKKAPIFYFKAKIADYSIVTIIMIPQSETVSDRCCTLSWFKWICLHLSGFVWLPLVLQSVLINRSLLTPVVRKSGEMWHHLHHYCRLLLCAFVDHCLTRQWSVITEWRVTSAWQHTTSWTPKGDTYGDVLVYWSCHRLLLEQFMSEEQTKPCRKGK